MTQLSDRIGDELARQAGVYAAVEERDGAIVLSGIIESEEQRQAAFDIVNAIAPDMTVVDDFELDTVLPEEMDDLDLSESDAGQEMGATPGTGDNEALEPGDFTDQGIFQNPAGASGPSNTAGADADIAEGEEVYIPPIDPVRDRDNEVLGGFAVSSTDSVEPARSALDNQIGDEALADAIRRELKEDSATNGLTIHVHVENGVVRLRGLVQDVIDAENAEEVAARVPGVLEVLEELDVQSGAF